jgi:hypothetical protein
MKDKTQSPAMARSAERAAAARDPLRIAARSFARALGQSAASSEDHLSILDRGRALAANGFCRLWSDSLSQRFGENSREGVNGRLNRPSTTMAG